MASSKKSAEPAATRKEAAEQPKSTKKPKAPAKAVAKAKPEVKTKATAEKPVSKATPKKAAGDAKAPEAAKAPAPAKKAASTVKTSGTKPANTGTGGRKSVKKPVMAQIAPEQRRHYVEVAAYYIAERRGFCGGSPAEDWALAEQEIDRLLAEGLLNSSL